MRCVSCHRPMRAAWVVTRSGPVGPKCGRALGLERPRLPKEPRMRLFSVRRGKADDRQLDWIAELAA